MPVMVASYPGAVATFSTKYDFTDVIFAAHINALQMEVTAIQQTLGTNPHGVDTSVRTRLESIEGGLATLQSYFDGSGHIPESSVTNLASDLAAINASIGSLNAALAARLLASNNLSDLTNKPLAVTNLGAAAAAHGHSNYVDLTTAQNVSGVKTFIDGLKASSGAGLRTLTADFGGDGGTRPTSTSYSKTLSGSSSLIDTTFVAPPSGRIVQILFARIGPASGATGYFSTRTRVNPTGTIVADYDDNTAVLSGNTGGTASYAAYRSIAGLVAGTTYRIEGAFKSPGGNSWFDSFGVVLLPSVGA